MQIILLVLLPDSIQAVVAIKSVTYFLINNNRLINNLIWVIKNKVQLLLRNTCCVGCEQSSTTGAAAAAG